MVSVQAKEPDKSVPTYVAVFAALLSNAESKEERPNSIPHYIKIKVVESILKKIDIAHVAKQKVSKNASVFTEGKRAIEYCTVLN